jgi:hypothetical protein
MVNQLVRLLVEAARQAPDGKTALLFSCFYQPCAHVMTQGGRLQ